jgi:hypothetical protein
MDVRGEVCGCRVDVEAKRCCECVRVGKRRARREDFSANADELCVLSLYAPRKSRLGQLMTSHITYAQRRLAFTLHHVRYVCYILSFQLSQVEGQISPHGDRPGQSSSVSITSPVLLISAPQHPPLRALSEHSTISPHALDHPGSPQRPSHCSCLERYASQMTDISSTELSRRVV